MNELSDSGIVAVDRLQIDLDHDFRFRVNGLPECQTTALLEIDEDCGPGGKYGNSRVGAGPYNYRTLEQLPGRVSAYYQGQTQNGNIELVFSWQGVQFPNITFGRIIDSPKQGYSKRLSLEVPTVYPGQSVQALDMRFERSFQDQGTTRDFFGARCSSLVAPWIFEATYNFRDGALPPESRSGTQFCSRP